jgi:uncharacterized protein (TIGR02186 family)
VRTLLAALALFASAPATAQQDRTRAAQETQPRAIAIGLTQDVVAVDAGFAGADVVLFGALKGAPLATQLSPLDIIAVLRGPPDEFRLRPLLKKGMIWAPGPGVRVEGAPSFHLASATRPIDEIAPAETLLRLGVAPDPEAVAARIRMLTDDSAAYVGAVGALDIARHFIELAQAVRRYALVTGGVEIEDETLFKLTLRLPPAVTVGAYRVDVYLFRDGALLAQDSAGLVVRKVGVERAIFDFARRFGLLYGIACVALSLAAGWLAALAFRR